MRLVAHVSNGLAVAALFLIAIDILAGGLESESQFEESFYCLSAARALSSTMASQSVSRICTRNLCMNHTLGCSRNASRRLAPSGSFTIPLQWTKIYLPSGNRIITTLRQRALMCGLF